jgi:hypothetical protein
LGRSRDWYKNPYIKGKIDGAWNKSWEGGPHEEGGWIFYNPVTKQFDWQPWPSGKPADPVSEQFHMDPPVPKPPAGYCVVGSFHTHPTHGNLSPGDKHHVNHTRVPVVVLYPEPPFPQQPEPGQPAPPYRPKTYYPASPAFPGRLK